MSQSGLRRPHVHVANKRIHGNHAQRLVHAQTDSSLGSPDERATEHASAFEVIGRSGPIEPLVGDEDCRSQAGGKVGLRDPATEGRWSRAAGCTGQQRGDSRGDICRRCTQGWQNRVDPAPHHQSLKQLALHAHGNVRRPRFYGQPRECGEALPGKALRGRSMPERRLCEYMVRGVCEAGKRITAGKEARVVVRGRVQGSFEMPGDAHIHICICRCSCTCNSASPP